MSSGHTGFLLPKCSSLVGQPTCFEGCPKCFSVAVYMREPLGRFFYIMGHPRPLFRLFSVFFKQAIQFLQQINVKKCHVHPVSGARI